MTKHSFYRYGLVSLFMVAVIAAALLLLGASSVFAAPGTKPPAPTGLTAASTAAGVNLTWQAPADASTIAGYRILRRSPSAGQTTLSQLVSNTGITSTNYIDTSVRHGDKYIYRVRSLNAAEAKSKKSGGVSIRYSDPTHVKPGKPGDLTASNTDEGIHLDWQAPSGALPITGYKILKRSPSAGQTDLSVLIADTGNSSTNWTDTAVDDGEKYVYRVKAINAAGVGPMSRAAQSRWNEPEPEPAAAPPPVSQSQQAPTTNYVAPIHTYPPVEHGWTRIMVGSGPSSAPDFLTKVNYSFSTGGLTPDNDETTLDYIISVRFLNADLTEAVECNGEGFGNSHYVYTVETLTLDPVEFQLDEFLGIDEALTTGVWRAEAVASDDCAIGDDYVVHIEVLTKDREFINESYFSGQSSR